MTVTFGVRSSAYIKKKEVGIGAVNSHLRQRDFQPRRIFSELNVPHFPAAHVCAERLKTHKAGRVGVVDPQPSRAVGVADATRRKLGATAALLPLTGCHDVTAADQTIPQHSC